VSETPPLTMQLVPPLSDLGILDLVSVNRGAVLNPVTPVALGVPDDFAFVVKFGALADLLSKDGLANDPARAQYAESRYQQGVKIAKTSSVVWSARVNDIPIPIGSLTEADDFLSEWQTVTGRPETLLLSNGTLVALTPVPTAGPFSVTLDIVRNAPVPILLTDYLAIGPEIYDGLLDNAEHLSLVKEGYEAIQSSMPLLERFYRMAGVTIQLETAASPTRELLIKQSTQDETHTARVESRS
jgi:hypothetical protein